MTVSKNLIGVLSLLAVGVLFGLSGVIAKYLSASLNPYQVVEYRFGIALVASLLLLAFTRKKLDIRRFNKKSLIFFAISFPISVVLFTLSIFNTSVAIAVFSFYTATLLTSFVLGRLFFNEALTTTKQVAFVLALLAVIILTDPFGSPSLGIGFVFGLLSGVMQGIASSFQKQLSDADNRIGLVALQGIAGLTLATLILGFIREPIYVSLAEVDWLIAVFFGLSMLAISYLFLIGFKYTNLNTGSIIVSSELLFGPLFAYLLLGEQLGMYVLIGGIVAALAAIFANLPDRKPAKVVLPV